MIRNGYDPVVQGQANGSDFPGARSKGFSGRHRDCQSPEAWHLDAAYAPGDLVSPPGNRLERLSGDRAGQHSIRVNGQFRVCFIWVNGHAENVEIVDYH